MKAKVTKSLVFLFIILSASLLFFVTSKVSAAEDKEPTEPIILSTEQMTEPASEITGGWVNLQGSWRYYSDNGVYLKSGVYSVDNRRYMFDSNGYVTTGFFSYSGNKYYAFETGGTPQLGLGAVAEYTGWHIIGNSTYYFNSNNSVAIGWQKISEELFHFDSNGKMSVSWTKIGNKNYYFKRTGKLGVRGRVLSGWKNIDGKRFYFSQKSKAGSKGAMLTGIRKIGKNKYYFKTKGKKGNKGSMKTGWVKVGKYNYYFVKKGKSSEKGKMVTNSIAGNKKAGYGYVDSKGIKISTKAINLAVDFVKSHTSNNQSRSEKLRTCFNYLWRSFPYQRVYGLPTADTLTKNFGEYMLKNKRGNCFCFGTTFAMIAKVLGYNSRVGVGLIAAAGGGMTPHGWAEIQINGQWLLCDPDMQKEIHGINSYMTTRGGYHYPLRTNAHYTLTLSKGEIKWKKSL